MVSSDIQYQQYEHEIWEAEKGLLWTPFHVEENLKQAGFVDIQIRKVQLKLWAEGTISPFILTDADPKMVAAAEAAVAVFSGVVDPLVDKMDRYFPDPKERAHFSQRVQEDMANKSYRLYSTMYCLRWTEIDSRICAIGRKPEGL